MELFSFECNNCGKYEQLEWTDDCIIGLKNFETGYTFYVKGEYTGYGKVIIKDENGDFHYVFPLQFEEYFNHWADGTDENPQLYKSIVCFDIYCNGLDGNNEKRNCFRDRILSPVLEYIPKLELNNLIKWGQ